MKKLVAVALAASALSMARAAECSPQEFTPSELGTVERVHQVPILELLPNVFEHSLKPATADEVVVRVDDGARNHPARAMDAALRGRRPRAAAVEQPWAASGTPLIDCGCNCVVLPRNGREARRRENA